jgi:hypothetical protein
VRCTKYFHDKMDRFRGGWYRQTLPEFKPCRNSKWARPIAESRCIDATSVIFVLDHRGVIRHRWVGSPGTKVLDEVLARLIQNAEKAAKKEPK